MTVAAAGADRRFFLFMAILCAVIIFVGFTPSYYLKGVFHAPPPLSAMTMVHGVVFTAWVLLFVLQTALIGSGRPALHRNLGVLGAVLFGAVVTVGVATAISAARQGHAPPGAPAPLAFLVLPMLAIISAAILVMLALANRSRGDYHKRLMLAGFILMTPPAVHRLALGAGQVNVGTLLALFAADVLLVGSIVYDTGKHRRLHPAYLWSAIIYTAVNLGVVWGFSSPQWLAIARWMTQA